MPGHVSVTHRGRARLDPETEQPTASGAGVREETPEGHQKGETIGLITGDEGVVEVFCFIHTEPFLCGGYSFRILK